MGIVSSPQTYPAKEAVYNYKELKIRLYKVFQHTSKWHKKEKVYLFSPKLELKDYIFLLNRQLLASYFLIMIAQAPGSKRLPKVPLRIDYLTIIPRARMDSEAIAHEAEGRMGY